ncbi:ribosomal protein S18-alanine N-acetyltransferase [Salinisphaera sp.]|uniref:ribosomal protein S18-alanine N-acetyltransferase n=1 Tax=Salinisphaera sp. TaxID=1914330 RepID=UPI000C4F5635|nr:ribosomal protein S18-alanine N-acetyltransferase [Salinisphaera sp.]MAS09638.1 ribosomal-protein-alanine N-acetyltransferase [Salinisphaera sp.]|tara:strand:+ start:1264 stop:1731 length:468 start_codon:yes stop_codon:yes gene_type:complete
MSVEPRQLIGVRGMRSRDVPAVLEIEQVSYGYPWSERIFRDCLRVGYHAWVATDLDEQVIGYALLSVAVGEAHVLNLCVAPDARGHGVADRLLEALIGQAQAERAERVLLEVRPSNKSARRLYKRCGFERIATRPGYYPAPDGREDALLLALDLI